MNVKSNGELMNKCGAVSPAGQGWVGTGAHAISSDGSRVFFLSPTPMTEAAKRNRCMFALVGARSGSPNRKGAVNRSPATGLSAGRVRRRLATVAVYSGAAYGELAGAATWRDPKLYGCNREKPEGKKAWRGYTAIALSWRPNGDVLGLGRSLQSSSTMCYFAQRAAWTMNRAARHSGQRT